MSDGVNIYLKNQMLIVMLINSGLTEMILLQNKTAQFKMQVEYGLFPIAQTLSGSV